MVTSNIVIHIVVYIALFGSLLCVVALIIKYLGNFENTSTIEELATPVETDHLIANKSIISKYGTCDEEELESGNCSKNKGDELNDGKICIICFEEERDCFFVPCGHCATCQLCADRIVNEESKRCPICRSLIRRVKKSFFLYKKKLGWLRTKVLPHLDDKSKSTEVS